MTTTAAPVRADNRAAYIGFALAFVIGHGSAALSKGADPLITLPGWLPVTLLASGLIPALVLSIRAGIRSQQGAGPARKQAETLLGTAWCTGFIALGLAITGLTMATGDDDLQNVLWPAGSVLIVGLINIAEGAARSDTLHYTLGSWLALVAGGALFFDLAGVYGVLAVLGGLGYAVAAARSPG